MRLPSLCVVAVSVSVFAPAGRARAESEEEVRKLAETYLAATTGEGDESGKALLLGGPSMDASLFSLENGKILNEDPVKREKGNLGSAVKLMHDLDSASKAAIAKMGGGSGDEFTVTELTGAEAAKMMKPTTVVRQKFLKTHPVLAKALRVDKEVYWHPKNAMRPVMRKAGSRGQYTMEEPHRYLVQSFEGPRKVPRKWGLKLVRFETDSLDTGWKVLPASDWSAE